MLGPPEYLAALLALMNILTSRMKDNQKKEEKDKCKIYSYSEADKQCPNGRSHHIVPDRCWRSPGTRRKKTGRPSLGLIIDQLMDKFLQHRGGGYYYAEIMDEKKGQCICVSEQEHLSIHLLYDDAEQILGESASPPWTATLDTLETIGAKSVSEITGCNAKKIKETLRVRHQSLKLDSELILRADPSGKSGLTMQKFAETLFEISQKKVPK